MQHRLLRWLPAVIAPVVIAGVVAVPMVASASSPDLTPKSAQQVLELIAKAKDIKGFTGTVQQTSDLGLPSIPSTGAGSDSSTASALDLISGSHTAEVAVAGASKMRVALLDSSAESDVIRDGRSVWTWSSKTSTATHVVATGTAKPQAGSPTTTTPAALAEELLTAADGTTTVSVDRTQQVAGRDAYTLVLTPKTAATTVGSVRIAVDATTGLPLDVQVIARGATSAAFDTRFTDISYAVPAASRFEFTPPSGAKVTTKTITAPTHAPAKRSTRASSGPGSGSRPAITGSGWASIVTVPAADVPSSLASDSTVRRLTTTAGGDRVLHTALVNVLLTSDGRVLAGAVPVSALESAAG